MTKSNEEIFKNSRSKLMRFVGEHLFMGGYTLGDYCNNAMALGAIYHHERFYEGDAIEKGFYTKSQMIEKLQKYGIRKGNSGVEVEIWGTGQPMREFLWSEDMARACVYLMENVNFEDVKKLSIEEGSKEIRNCHLNIGTGKEISIKNIAELVARKVGFEGQIVFNTEKPDGTMRKLTNPSKINALGWKHTIDIDEGVEKLYKWYLGNV